MLSKNEQIVIFVLTFLAFAVAGTVFFVMPSRSEVNKNKVTRTDKQNQLHQLQEDFNTGKIDDLQKQVMEAYEIGSSFSGSFYEEINEYQADRLLRSFLIDVKDPYTDYKEPANIKTDNLELVGLATEPFALNVFVPPGVVYPIKDMAHAGTAGTLPPIASLDDLANMTTEAMILAMRAMSPEEAVTFYNENNEKMSPYIQAGMREVLAGTSETVAVQTITFRIPMSVDQANALIMNTLRNDKAVIIKSIEPSDIEADFGPDTNPPEPEKVTVGEQDFSIKTYSTDSLYTITIAFYCAERMDKPVFN